MTITAGEKRAMKRRAAERRKRIVGNVAKNFAEAEQWDLEFWQKQGPGGRLSALVDIREDIIKVRKSNGLEVIWDD